MPYWTIYHVRFRKLNFSTLGMIFCPISTKNHPETRTAHFEEIDEPHIVQIGQALAEKSSNLAKKTKSADRMNFSREFRPNIVKTSAHSWADNLLHSTVLPDDYSEAGKAQ